MTWLGIRCDLQSGPTTASVPTGVSKTKRGPISGVHADTSADSVPELLPRHEQRPKFWWPPSYHGHPGRNGLRCALSVAHLGYGHAMVTFMEADKRRRILFRDIDGCLERGMTIWTLGNLVSHHI